MANRRTKLEYALKLVPEIDDTATRQAVRELFQVYRKYRLLLSMKMEEHEEVTPKRGYANAMDPNLIRTEGFESSTPRVRGPEVEYNSETAEYIITRPIDKRRRAFIKQVEIKVNELPPYQRDIMKHHYMQKETPGTGGRTPSDLDTWLDLREHGWVVGETYYYEEKSKAIFMLAEVFNITQYTDSQESEVLANQ